MASKAKIYLYKEGNECTSLTGGWEDLLLRSKGGTITRSRDNNCLYVKASINVAYPTNGGFATVNKIDFSKHSFLCFDYLHTRTTENSLQHHSLGILTDKSTSTSDLPSRFSVRETPIKDIRTLTTEKTEDILSNYVAFSTGHNSTTSEIYCYNVYLITKENIITINSQTQDSVTFSANNLGLVTISKIDVLVNGKVSKTYTENYTNLSYQIDKSLYYIGNNIIEIRVTYSQGDDITETVSEYLTYAHTVENLPTSSNLIQVFDRQELLNNALKSQRNSLKNILKSKNVEVTEEDKMSDLIYKVNDLGEFIQPILYIYKEGDECINVTGGWDFNNCSYSSAFSKNNGHLTKNSTNFYGTLPTYWSIYYRGTSNKIDLSNYNKLKCKISNYTSATNSAFDIYVSYEDANFLNKTPVASARNTTTGESVLELDISQIFSAYNIFISLFCGSASGGAGASVTVSEIWLEV